MSIVAKSAFAAIAALGVGGIVAGDVGHEHVVTDRKVDRFVREKHVEYSDRSFREYSPYEWTRGVRHWIHDQRFLIPFQRAGMYVSGWKDVLIHNVLPLGLAATGIIYGLGSCYSRVFQNCGGVLKPAAQVGAQMGTAGVKAGWYGLVESAKWGLGQMKNLIPNTPNKAIAIACGAGMVLYLAKKLSDELLNINTENAVGQFLKHPEGHEYH